MRKKKYWILALCLIIGGYAAWRWKTKKAKAPAYETVAVSRGDIRLTVLNTGVVKPRNRLELKPPIAGRVERVLVQEGQEVRKGQVLAWLSSTERAALLDAARAKGAEELARWEDLYKPAPLIAPLDGVVIARKVEPGQTVTAADAVLVMSDKLILKAQVDETDVGQIRLGQKAAIALDAYPREPFDGKVEHIAFEAETVNNVTIYEVDVLPLTVPPFMRSGMTANITFLVEEKKDALTVPTEALREHRGRTTVLTPPAKPKEKPVPVDVVPGISDGKRTEIVEGVKEGDTVLIPVFTLGPAAQQSTNPLSPQMRRPRGMGGSGGGGRRQ